MRKFYKKVAPVFLVFLFVTFVLAGQCVLKFFHKDSLFPRKANMFGWQSVIAGNEISGGGNAISVLESNEMINFDYTLNKDSEHPFAMFILAFDKMDKASRFVNLKAYKEVSFRVRCSHPNALTFNLRTVDPVVTRKNDPTSYRLSSHWFHCSDLWTEEHIDLQHMQVPVWWLERFGLEIHDRDYQLDQVHAFSFEASRHGPLGISSNVRVADLYLHQRNWPYLLVCIALLILLWVAFFVWFFREHARYLAGALKQKILIDEPLDAYQRVSLESQKDKEKSAVLSYMAKAYFNSDLNLEILMKELGVNRRKVNEILKEEQGLTFSAYLNKLRLAEAARLLGKAPERSIHEIALFVGYKNVTYFNKIFKEKYGSSPGKFKSLKLK